VVQVIPIEIEGGFPRGEQNTLRRSNVEVGEGKPVPAIQEVMLPIHIESLEGDPEILVKTAISDPGNVECSWSLLFSGAASGGPKMASLNLCDINQSREALPMVGPEENFAKAKSSSIKLQQQGGPRPGCTQEDQRPCQVSVPPEPKRALISAVEAIFKSEYPEASGVCLGKTMIRTLSIKRMRNVSEIWTEAEKRLGANRSHFSLITGGSRYLPDSGDLEGPKQIFEVRWRGTGGSKEKPDRQTSIVIFWGNWLSIVRGRLNQNLAEAIEQWRVGIGHEFCAQNWTHRGSKVQDDVNRTIAEFFEGIPNRDWELNVEGPDPEEAHRRKRREELSRVETQEQSSTGLIETCTLKQVMRVQEAPEADLTTTTQGDSSTGLIENGTFNQTTQPQEASDVGKTMLTEDEAQLNAAGNVNQAINPGMTIKEQSPGLEDATPPRGVADCPQSAVGDLGEVPELPNSHSASGACLGKTMISDVGDQLNEAGSVDQAVNPGMTIKEQSPGPEDATTHRGIADCPQSAAGDLSEDPEFPNSHLIPGDLTMLNGGVQAVQGTRVGQRYRGTSTQDEHLGDAIHLSGQHSDAERTERCDTALTIGDIQDVEQVGNHRQAAGTRKRGTGSPVDFISQ
jgi:ubiquitin